MNLKFLIALVFMPLLVFSQDYGKVTPSQGSDELIAPVNVQTLEAATVVLEKSIDPDKYRVGPGDIFSLYIKLKGDDFFYITVTPAGNLLLPSIGTVFVDGLSLATAQNLIRSEYSKVFPNLEISITLNSLRKFRVSLAGAVLNPGLVKVSESMRLSDMLSSTETKPLAEDFNIKIKNGDVTQTYDLTEYYVNGDLDQNPFLRTGDEVLVPFGSFEKNGIVVRGAVENEIYDAIKENESLGNYIRRKVYFNSELDIERISIARKVSVTWEYNYISIGEMDSFVLQAGDEINFQREKSVKLIGHIGNPGSYQLIPGATASDYITEAGGILSSGSLGRMRIIRSSGEVLTSSDTVIQKGDTIDVRSSLSYIVFGDSSLMTNLNRVITVMLAYLAIGNR